MKIILKINLLTEISAKITKTETKIKNIKMHRNLLNEISLSTKITKTKTHIRIKLKIYLLIGIKCKY